MERVLPEIEIEGTKHLFDIEQLALIEKDRPEKKLFFEQMKDCGTHYEFVYNLNSKRLDRERTLRGIDAYITGKHSFAKVQVPRMGEIDPIGMSKKYGCTLDDIRQKSDFEIIVDQEKFQKRLNGEPVSIDIAGKIYDVDISNNILRPQDGIGNEISFDKLHKTALYDNEHHSYLVIYNRVKGEVEQSDLFSKPQDYAIVEIPQQQFLDPIGFNIENGYDPKDGLIVEEWQFLNKATFVPWETYSQNFDNYLQADASLHWGVLAPLLEEARLHNRDLPTINIHGTDFIVDTENLQLKQKENPETVIPLSAMRDAPDGYTFQYSLGAKCCDIYGISENILSDVVTVKIPEFVVLDPAGMAQKYGLSIDKVKGKTDFEIMVNQEAYDLRVNKGMLPTVEIAEHPFYVDIRMGKLRPKDDFLSNGIVFSDIERYYNADERTYTIPYNPKTHEFQEPDYKNLKEFPKDLIAVEIPFERLLDRIGWNRMYGIDINNGIKVGGLNLQHQARNIPWERTFVAGLIESNLKSEKRQKETHEKRQPNEPKPNKRKGRKM